MLTASTRLVALIGHPVAHSLSPRMQNAAFAARGLDWAYVACDVPAERLAEAVAGLRALGFAGANVTAPHKVAAARLDSVETDAPAVNVLRFTGERIEGWMSDPAILDELDPPRRPAVIGGGGAAAQFVHTFRRRGLEPRVFARRADWPPEIEGSDLVVNATAARDDVLARLGAGQTLVELPYPDSATASAGRAAGARVVSGLEVLVAQGAASFELWTGVPAPVEVMRAAVGLPA